MTRLGSPLAWLGGLLALYLLAPIAAFFLRLPGAGANFGDPRLWSALEVSAAAATVSATIIAVLGVPLAYGLARARGRLAGFIGVAIQLPLALPPLVSGILLVSLVGPYTLVGRWFGGSLTDSFAGIVLAQTFVAAPFLVIAARSAFAAIDPALPAVAATLGHGPLSRFFRVSLPIALPGIAAGLLLAWLRAFGEFGATVILSYHPYSLPVFTYVQFSSTGLPATQAPVVASLFAAFVVLMLANLRVLRRRHRRVTRPPATPPVVQAAPRLDFDLAARLDAFGLQIAHAAATRHLALLGPSGAGKSFTLRLLAGLEATDAGHVRAGDEELSGLRPEHRRIGYLPQHSSLLPGRNVWQQINFGVGADPGVASYWLERLHLDGLEARYPDELSGGQQRRVALARALTHAPRILLLDEPFSALDAPVRDSLRRELRRLQQEVGLTTVLVTHDPEEAALLADEVLVLDRGTVLQAGRRADVFARPSSPQVARLLGIRNMGHGRMAAADTLETAGVRLVVHDDDLAPGTRVAWCLRSERVRLDANGPYDAAVVDVVDLGASREIVVRIDDALELTLRTVDADGLVAGGRCRIDLPPEAIRLWPENGAG
ncbi:ATP-binding cassette domain-containing protein [Salinisphaera hydrothermalis]|uniref:ATP-binding cassette domain-containing protein n=1 Tax=Salinisphaera hydrothermalis TaxID=563188 RepID=UPI0033401CB5